MGRLEGKIAIVTGAANGIGEASARALAREGASVILTDIRDEGEIVAASIRDSHGQSIFLHQDVTDESRWADVIRTTIDRFGRIDALINNAGVARSAPPEEETLENWRLIMRTNLESVFLGTKYAIRAMKAQNPKGGSIVNLSSNMGMVGGPNLGAYSASKGGVRLYTKSAALSCAKAGLNIRINSIHPGIVRTPMVENALDRMRDPGEQRRAMIALHPIGRLGEPEEIAGGVLYLVSDESRFVTGSELVIDGGYTAQ